MNYIISGIIVLILSITNIQSLSSKMTKMPGQWSLFAGGNFATNFGISNSMLGTMESVETEYLKYNDYKQFPFADSKTKNSNFTLNLSYRLPEDNLGFFINLESTIFNVDNDLRTIWGDPLADVWGTLRISSFIPGIEYNFGNTDELFNAFGRLGISFNIVGGEVRYHNYYVDLIPAFRIGLLTEIGGRINIPSTPLSFEVSGNYTNVNLIGKTRDQEWNYLSKIELNDAADPDNSDIPAKTIDFISLKFGLRVWF